MVDMTFYNPIVLKKITGTARTLKSYYDRIKEFMGGCDTCPYCNGRGCDFCCGAKGGCCGGTLSLKKLKKKRIKRLCEKTRNIKKGFHENDSFRIT
jgi:Fe-S cluster biogenesis protein NfuA